MYEIVRVLIDLTLISLEANRERARSSGTNRQIAEERIAIQKRERECNFPGFGGQKKKGGDLKFEMI